MNSLPHLLLPLGCAQGSVQGLDYSQEDQLRGIVRRSTRTGIGCLVEQDAVRHRAVSIAIHSAILLNGIWLTGIEIVEDHRGEAARLKSTFQDLNFTRGIHWEERTVNGGIQRRNGAQTCNYCSRTSTKLRESE
jgi:hypothetical protein